MSGLNVFNIYYTKTLKKCLQLQDEVLYRNYHQENRLQVSSPTIELCAFLPLNLYISSMLRWKQGKYILFCKANSNQT
jgi:hypothetical protein